MKLPRISPLAVPGFVALRLISLALPAAAAVGSWSPLGPDGESINGLAADPANPDLV